MIEPVKGLQDLRDVHAIQGAHGNWNYSPYAHGMYNGLELALALMEGREPDYRTAPDKWLAEQSVLDAFNLSQVEGS